MGDQWWKRGRFNRQVSQIKEEGDKFETNNLESSPPLKKRRTKRMKEKELKIQKEEEKYQIKEWSREQRKRKKVVSGDPNSWRN